MSTASNQPEALPGYGDRGDELERHVRVQHNEELEAGNAHTCMRLAVESRAKPQCIAICDGRYAPWCCRSRA